MDFLLALGAIIVLDVVLGGDNAVVIAMASRDLPPAARKRAIYLGTAGAIIIRLLMTFVAVWLLTIPYIQAVGGLLLLPIAFKLLKPAKEEKEVLAEVGFWSAIRTIVIADVAMGVDNVLAVAGAAAGHFELVVIGILISIPIIVCGSQLIAKLLNKYPSTVLVGIGILAWTAGTMFLHDKIIGALIRSITGDFEYIVPVVITAFVVMRGYRIQRQGADDKSVAKA